MKKFTVILLVFFAFTINAQNLILNGSFEHNNIATPEGNCLFEINNAAYTSLMDSSVSTSYWGGLSNGIFFDRCSTYTSVAPDNMVYDGDYSVFGFSIDTIINNIHYEMWTSFSLALSQPLLLGSYYHLSYYQKVFPHIYPNHFKEGSLLIGISEQDTSFGTVVDTISYTDYNWERIEFVFRATIPAEHLTVKGMLTPGNHGSLLDNFVLTLNSFAVLGVNEQEAEKQLLYITDVLGRQSKPTPNVPLFYRYDDGTVEKRIVIE